VSEVQKPVLGQAAKAKREAEEVSKRRVNKYCSLSSLKNESDVEQFFVAPLLAEMGYDADYLETKTSIEPQLIGKGRKRRRYFPDYIGHLRKAKDQPVVLVDAKHPNESAEAGVDDAQMYASIVRRALAAPKPEQFCVGCNGRTTIVKHYDSNEELLRLEFADCVDGNPSFDELRCLLSRQALQAATNKLALRARAWKPAEASIENIKDAFQKCHNRIWKRESLLPTAAFYEFTKLVFLKLREDERIHRLVDAGQQVTLNDLHFHTEWIDDHSEVSPNPINSILFRRLNDDLTEQVGKKKKKPIFDPGEQIKLKPSTIRAVVSLLQDYDLHGIDDDLNGRMFEVFLSAAVRGKNLGAFFTPRNIVELMVEICSPSTTRKDGRFKIDRVLDGCCGSGGFLIDAMAFMLDEIRSNPNLSAHAKELEKRLLAQCLFGIESNPDITRIARINMFLHGDGGSRIYRADTLDKEFCVEEGDTQTARDEITELAAFLEKKANKFDVVLTNPPFASAYSPSDEHEKRILQQYSDLHPDTTTKRSAKSNVLFLARYYDLLKPKGRMAIVLDNSMLNSHNFAEYRKWLLGHFILRAVIALPKYSFIQAGAGGVTSILHLEKRKDREQKQPAVFARNVRYTGISKSGKEIKENDLPKALREWRHFEKTGRLRLDGTGRIGNSESDELFLIQAGNITDRIDVAYHTPSYTRLVERIDQMGKDGTHEIRRIDDFELAGKIDLDEAGDDSFKYVDIGAIDLERCTIMPSEIVDGTIGELADRARMQIRQNDVIFPLSHDSLGKVAIVPKELDGQLASTGFVAVRNQSLDDAVLLWSVIRSRVMQKQFRHIASGYTQRGISTQHLKEVRFPLPIAGRPELIKSIKRSLDAAHRSRRSELTAMEKITGLLDTSLDSTQ